MRDIAEDASERVLRAGESLRDYLRESGYALIDTPLLEETELFVRKSGGELTSRLYSFTDPDGHKVSLRPEFTSSVIRHFVQERGSLAVPVRWQYSGPVFRYDPGQGGGHRQFTQVGAELVGAGGPEADVEMIRLAWEGLRRVGVEGCQLRLGHLGVLDGLLTACGLSEPAKLFIIGNVRDLKSGRTDVASLAGRAEDVGLLTRKAGPGAQRALADLDAGARELVQDVLRESIPAPVGRRTPDQIVARLLRKVRDADDPTMFEDGLRLVSELGRLTGPPHAVLEKAQRVVSDRRWDAGGFDELERLLAGLAAGNGAGIDLVLDFGLARGISYYTGVIFELMCPVADGSISLGGGGRYDGLVRILGGDEDVPALGFAYNLERVVAVSNGAGQGAWP